MGEPGEQVPILHPALEKYPGSPTALVRVDGVLYEVPLNRDRDEAVPVPVNDLMQARTAVHQLLLILRDGGLDDYRAEAAGRALVGGMDEEPPITHQQLGVYLEQLRRRLNSWLPMW